MYHLRKDTLAGLKLSGLFLKRPMIDQPLAVAVSRMVSYEKNPGGKKNPEAEALKFYYANHVFSLIAAKYGVNEPLPEVIVDLARGYVKMSSDLIVRLAYYCLLITTREARHLHASPAFYNSIEAKFGSVVLAFIKKICGTSEDGAVNALRTSPPAVSLGQYMSAITYVFNDGKWSGGYGGPKWGKVAETLRQMIYGDITPEMFSDIAFTLAHNNGPIFNKGMLYGGYTQFLLKLLDVQRSGQVPQLLGEGVGAGLVTSDVSEFAAHAKHAFPHELGGHVDWFKVERLGALHHYPVEKQNQLAAHGPSVFTSEMEKLEGKKFYITPQEHVMLIERELEQAA